MNPDGNLKIMMDKKYPNTVEIELEGESHTLGNLITEKFLEDKRCTFSAFKIKHPLEEKLLVKVSTGNNCEVMPFVLEVLKNLSKEIKDCAAQFEEKGIDGGFA